MVFPTVKQWSSFKSPGKGLSKTTCLVKALIQCDAKLKILKNFKFKKIQVIKVTFL